MRAIFEGVVHVLSHALMNENQALPLAPLARSAGEALGVRASSSLFINVFSVRSVA